MNNNCEFREEGYCLCDACRSMREAIRETEKRYQGKRWTGFSGRLKHCWEA